MHSGHTAPTGSKGGKPGGRRTTIEPNDKDPDNIRALNSENRSSDLIADSGYKIEQNPHVPDPKNPDYLIEGHRFDCKSPTTDKPRNAAGEIERSIKNGQVVPFWP